MIFNERGSGTEKITTKITKLEVRTGRDNQKYIVLWTNPRKIIVFTENIPRNEWVDLKEGNVYEMDIKQSKKGIWLLKNFNHVYVFTWPPKIK